MEILADQDITAVTEAFAGIGRLRLFEGRRLRAADLGQAEVLLVRSVSRVDAALIAGSALRFVGTATAGIDHIDTAALAAGGIAFADAAGCNARAVAEHVVTCIYHYAALRAVRPQALTVGIVGFGNVGRALGELLDRLAISHVVNDPPLAASSTGIAGVALETALACDVVSLHVPLTTSGDHPTVNLLDRDALHALAPGALLINAARGGVLDEAALCERLDGRDPPYAAIDCWSDEPAIDDALLRRAWFASPHLAGHSREARLTATRMLHAALARYLAADARWSLAASGEPPPILDLAQLGGGVRDLLAHVHPMAAHTARLRRMLALPPARRGGHFDDVRRRYGLRREFGAWCVACAAPAPDTVAELRALGFAGLGTAPV